MPSSDVDDAAAAPQGPSSLLDDTTTAATTKHGALVSSWIRNEGQCVTVAHLALNLGVSRTRACEMLEREAERTNGVRLRATRCQVAATALPTNPSKSNDGDVVPCTGTKIKIEFFQCAISLSATDLLSPTHSFFLALITSVHTRVRRRECLRGDDDTVCVKP
jgi:hypothetical protein